jgi:hypothetical protein
VYLKKCVSRKTNRIYLQISQGYRDKNGKPKAKVVKSIGYLDELQKEYDDPIAHFTEVAKSMTEAASREKVVTFQIASDALIEKGVSNRKNYGHIVFSKIYHELEIDRFLDNKRRHENFKFNSEAIMRLMVFGRLLYPHSKKKTFEMKDRFFDSFKFTLDDIYESLTHYDKIAVQLQRFLHERIVERYNRDTSLIYYDVTNYYFEIDITLLSAVS